jgi:hypothetical protein
MIASLELGRFRLSVIIGRSGGAFESSRRIIGQFVDGDMNPRGTFSRRELSTRIGYRRRSNMA